MNKTALFLKRIGLSPDVPVTHTIDFLNQLQNACVQNIAYENLDILAGKSISLEFDDLFEKIVTQNRGGYCFELNGFLIHMLREMDFTVHDRFARFLRNESTIPMRRHRVAVVSLAEGDYLCDIAVGQIAPRLPVKLEDGLVQKQPNGEIYKPVRDARHGWVIYEQYKGDWRQFICFTEDDQFDVDYIQPHYFCLTHPDSIFNKKYMLSIKTPSGRCTLDGPNFKIFHGEVLEHLEENISEERLRELFQEVFKLRLP